MLRGPQGTLYGRNSIGGAINIITKEPDQGDLTKINTEFGTRGRVKADLFVNHGLTDTLSFNMNMAFNKRDGLGEFINVPDAEYDVGETEDVSGRLSVKWEPSNDFRMVLTADGNNGDGGLRPYTVLIDELQSDRYYGGDNPLGVALRNTDVTPEGYDIYDNATGEEAVTGVSNEARGLALTTEWDMNDDYTLKLVASTRSSKYKAGLDDDGTIYSLDHYPERGEADQTSIELQLNGYINEYTDFVAGLYYFNEEGKNRQGEDSSYNTWSNLLELDQETTSKAVYVNVRRDLTDELSLSGGLRYTEDEKDASASVSEAIGTVYSSDNWDEVTWEIASNYTFENGMTGYATIQSGYQSGQYPARPYCLFGDIECFVASDNITAVNYEVGIKGRVNEYFDVSVAVFNTDFDDLPYQVSKVTENGFETDNQIVTQTSRGIELDTTFNYGNFSMMASVGYMDVDVDEQDGYKPVAPLTPDLTLAIGPSYTFDLEGGDSIRVRADYSYRSDMYGEPSSLASRQTELDSRELVNVDIAYTPADDAYTVALYGRNIFDERYDNARLNTGDYIIQVLSNDASEFGVRFSTEF